MVVACVGGGSNAAGIFCAVPRRRGRRAGRRRGRRATGSRPGKHAASIVAGAVGILHGSKTLRAAGRATARSSTRIRSAPGWTTPASGREHALWADAGRVEYCAVTDDEALAAFHELTRLEGIIPALESAHAVAEAAQAGGRAGAGRRASSSTCPAAATRTWTAVLELERRRRRTAEAHEPDRRQTFEALQAAGRKGLVGYLTAGDPGPGRRRSATSATAIENGVDVLELGVPVLGPDGGRARRSRRRRSARWRRA